MRRTFCIAAVLSLGIATVTPAAELVVNGGFETGTLAGWTEADQVGGAGTIVPYTGTASPINGFTVAAPPGGTWAAMSDQSGPGSHVLYQDIVVPTDVVAATLSFERYVNNQGTDFFTPATLDFSGVANQQARVDLMTATSDPFSVAAGDVLLNAFQTNPGDPLVSGYSAVAVDVTSVLAARGGQTIRLRFAEVDNQLFFNFGIDQVSLNVTTRTAEPVPTPGAAAGAIPVLTLLASSRLVRRRRRTE